MSMVVSSLLPGINHLPACAEQTGWTLDRSRGYEATRAMFILLPQMGSKAACKTEPPRARDSLKNYCLIQYEVTQGRALSGGYTNPGCPACETYSSNKAPC